MPRRAVLVFANQVEFDLARRCLPERARPLFSPSALILRSSPAVDVHLFTNGPGANSSDPRFHLQVGRNFAERFEHAIETISALGYDEIVAIGRDCPGLRGNDIALAFSQLAEMRIVLGPDHRGGCYLIAFRAADRHLLRNMRWLRNTDCAQLLQRVGKHRVSLLAVKHDVDSWADLRLLSRLGDAIAAIATFLLRVAMAASREAGHFVDLAAQFVRIRGQLPPPSLAA